ncbi:PSD1 and planctomycete cytochrome C domain-containing protein [Haloferula sp. A504]|uniref:PSD1 and planctomycete cytochrome C domain-containing protein n=1 Tax=Haloferula sp. A504 TaxID=3373601 RepID=UPI0031CB6FEC|nr:PSD1 and planctomycete cytochrome C domain-containing protein [Verrucomicrobiaceae bacterium E54]
MPTLLGSALASAAEPVQFNRDIRPILSDRCFACHGPDEAAREADLRLDLEEAAKIDLGGYRAIVPGKPDQSELVRRIESTDEDEVMPPPDTHLSLDAEEKALLRRWIEEGATWEEHWSFQKIERPKLPEVAGPKWGRGGIDAFVLRRLRQQSLEPAPEVGREQWLRRVTQDLTGLPPSLEEIDAFVADDSPDACEKVVDRLLASVDHAERMTALWLDQARYADSNGYQFDNERTMWPWRDWVIDAFRANMPFDRFVTEQLAGDLLDEPTPDQLVATGFLRNHGYSIEGGIIDEEYRVMYANDKTATVGTLFLGLTLDCARCHDHKYDPVSIEEYYSMYAFFNTSAEKGAPGEDGRKQKAAAPFLEIDAAGETVRAMVMREQPRETFVLEQGQFDQPGDKVSPDTPAVLPSFDGYRPDRLGLARWLTADENPLFARVSVNRLWRQFFGRGLVKTVDNFGVQGELPTHPELLDWLAVEFRDSGWDLRHVIRLIVLSATYGQSSDFRDDLEDAENRLLARGPSFRLSGEMIRDQALAASGLLVKKIGGPSVRPYQPEGVWEDLNAPVSHAETYVQGTGDDLYRKSLYTYWRRAVPHPAMVAFDAPSRDVCTVERAATNTPLQALVTLHGPTFVEAARKLAEEALAAGAPVDLAFRRVLSRQPTGRERQIIDELHAERLRHYHHDPAAADRLLAVGESPVAAGIERAELAALADVCHAILNLSETVTRK